MTRDTRNLILLALCDIRDVKLRMQEIQLFAHRHDSETVSRRMEIADRRLTDRKAIANRLFQTRHSKVTP